MIWLTLGVCIAFAAVGYVLHEAAAEIEAVNQLRRNDARLAAERWQVAQERHDAIIELIAQIAEAKAPEVKGAPKQRRKGK